MTARATERFEALADAVDRLVDARPVAIVGRATGLIRFVVGLLRTESSDERWN